jgi:serine/threonine-protein kinase
VTPAGPDAEGDVSPDPSAARWREIDELFQRALDLPAAERSAFLAKAAAGDDGLRQSVGDLLAVAEDSGDFLDTPVEVACDLGWQDLLDSVDSGETSAESVGLPDRGGERVGPYRLLRRTGRGGMATVYLAERADGLWEQQVALKVIRRGLDTEDVIRRFLAERQILSSLQHPNIARLLDGGSTEDGLPYFVMEFVEGEPITAHCDARGLSVRERLALFCDVCRAVQVAHQSLVVHRDLKPSNILVTKDGVVKLLDFGIAKLLDDASEELTRTDRRLLTPQYASPEQVRGEPITTASDVYQLGVLLSVLLSGRRPYDVAALSPAQMEARITGAEPARPSRLVSEEAAHARGVTVERLTRSLRGDLDAIVLKALRRDSGDRYPSAESLVGDVQRHTSGHPVEATRGAFTYKASKFLRRHVAGMTTAAAFLVLLIGAVVALAQQRSRVIAAADRAEQVASFLASVFEDADPTTGVGDTMSVRTLLVRGAQRVDSELGDQPALQAELYGVIGNAFTNLGLLDEGTEILTAALEHARQAHGRTDEELEALEAALSDLASVHKAGREFELAQPFLEEVLELRRARLGPNAVEVAEALAELGYNVRDVVGPDSAAVILQQASEVPGLDPDSEEGVRISLGLAFVLRAQGKIEEAEALYREAIPKLRTLIPDDPELGTHINNLAFLLKNRGAYDEAASLYGEAHSLYAGTHGSGHPISLMLASNLSLALFEGGRVEEGETVMRERVEAAREQWPAGHWRVAATLEQRANANLRFGDGLIAVPVLREAVAEFTETQGERHSWTAAARAWLGAALLVVESAPEGGRELNRALADLEAYRSETGIDDRSFHVRQIADYLESHGLGEQADRLRQFLEG